MQTGNLTLAEGAVITNLTLPNGAAFPANPNLGEKYTLSSAIDANHPAGEYHYDGTAWQNLPTAAEVAALIASSTLVPSFKFVARALVSQPAVSADSFWFNGGQAISSSAGIPSAAPLTSIYIDPANYPAGTKLRLGLNANVNNVGTASSFAVSLRKVNRPASGGGADQVIFTPDSTALGSISVPNTDLVANASTHYYSSEFDMPSTAGMYAFLLVQTTNMTTDSCIQFIATLQAKY